MRDYEYITDATDNSLAEMLEEEAKKQENIASIAITEPLVDQCRELATLLRTAAKRLREKPTEWSEEDEGQLQNAIDALEFLGKRKEYYSQSGYDAALNAANWLKFLKPNHWKPSEEQIGALNYAYCELFKRGENGEGSNCVHPLMTLIDDLKKL